MESQHSAAIASYPPSISSKPHWNPHPYQERAIKLLLSQASAGLFLDPGLGKTSIVLAALKILKAKGLLGRCLIIAPLRVMSGVWPQEIEKWDDFQEMTWTILHGPKKLQRISSQTDIHLINPEGIPWLVETGKLSQYDVIVIDESRRFSNSQTKRFKALRPWLPSFRRRWILTGTPMPNGLMDLFGQMYILDLGRSLGRFITHYRREFFRESGYGGYEWTPQDDAFPRIIDRISPLILRLKASDYLQMPKLIVNSILVDLPAKARKIYKELDDEFIAESEGRSIVASTAAVRGVKLRQVCNGAVYDTEGNAVTIHDEKLQALDSLVEELGGAPLLVLYEFNHDRDRISALLGDSVPILGSGLNATRTNSIIAGFNAGDIPLLLGHPASMGHGLNLQGSCHHIVWFGVPWDLEYYEQAIARVYRQGQASDTVFVYLIAARKTYEDKIALVLGQKDRRQQGLLQALSDHRQEHFDVA